MVVHGRHKTPKIQVFGGSPSPQGSYIPYILVVLYLVYRPVCKMVLTEFLSGIKFVGP